MIVQKCSVCTYSVNCQVQDKAKKYPCQTGSLCVLIGYVSLMERRRKRLEQGERKSERHQHQALRGKKITMCEHGYVGWKEETWGRSNFNNKRYHHHAVSFFRSTHLHSPKLISQNPTLSSSHLSLPFHSLSLRSSWFEYITWFVYIITVTIEYWILLYISQLFCWLLLHLKLLLQRFLSL